MELKYGTTPNYGIIRFIMYRGMPSKLAHYTGKGLRELCKPDLNEEEKKKVEKLKNKSEKWLIKNEYIAITPYKNIKRFIS